MQVSITTRHTKLTEQLKDYATEKIQKVEKYFDKVIDAHVILGKEKYFSFAEATILVSGTRLHAKEEAKDIYAAIDLLSESLERQMKRFKEKLRTKYRTHRQKKKYPETESLTEETNADREFDSLVSKREYTTVPLTIKDALQRFEETGVDFLPFVNKQTGEVCIVYRKTNKMYGLLVPEK